MPKSATVNRPTPIKESSDKAVAQNAKQIVWVSIYEDSKSSSATTDRMRQMAAKMSSPYSRRFASHSWTWVKVSKYFQKTRFLKIFGFFVLVFTIANFGSLHYPRKAIKFLVFIAVIYRDYNYCF